MTQHTTPTATPVAPAVCADALARDIAALAATRKLLHAGEFEVYCAPAHELPHAMQEIARLREWAFRAVGEGTGQALDTDRFDHSYHQLFVWHPQQPSHSGGLSLGVYRAHRGG